MRVPPRGTGTEPPPPEGVRPFPLGRARTTGEHPRGVAGPGAAAGRPCPADRRAGLLRLARDRGGVPGLRVVGRRVFWRDGVPTGTVRPSCGTGPGVGDPASPGDWDPLRGVRCCGGYGAAQGAPWARPAARPAGWDVPAQTAGLPGGPALICGAERAGPPVLGRWPRPRLRRRVGAWAHAARAVRTGSAVCIGRFAPRSVRIAVEARWAEWRAPWTVLVSRWSPQT